MSTTTNADATEQILKQHRLRDLWKPNQVERLRDEADTEAERDVLEAVLDYNEAEREKWDVLGYDINSDPTDPPIRGMSYEALASKVDAVRDGDIEVDTLRQTTETGATTTPEDAVEAADPEARRQALRNLQKAPTFERKGMEARADTLRAEAAELLGVDGPEDIEVDTLTDHVDLDAATPEDEDGLEVDTMATWERVEEADQRRKKAKHHREHGAEERAADLEGEIDTLLAGLDRDELTEADYDALAEHIPKDYDAMAAEIDDPGELATRIDTLERKARSLRGRDMDDRADEVEAELDALRDRAEELTR